MVVNQDLSTVMTTIFVRMILANLLLDVFIHPIPAMTTTHAPTILVLLLPVAGTLQLFVMTTMHVKSTVVIRLLDV
jgi:hypothetical protein